MVAEIGRLCVKVAGRDAGLKCVVVDVLDSVHVLIDGETRRRKCNVKHLEPLDKVLDVKKSASRSDVKKAFKGLGVELTDSKPKKAGERPKKVKVKKVYVSEEPKKDAKPAKKEPVVEKKTLSKDEKPSKPSEKPDEAKNRG